MCTMWLNRKGYDVPTDPVQSPGSLELWAKGVLGEVSDYSFMKQSRV
jgi:hypothetical protein